MLASPNNNLPEPGFGLYFHWPFCRKKCPYCDFNSHVRGNLDESVWIEGLLAELSYFADRSDLKVVTSIFFGGGTPSLMSEGAVARLIDGASKHFKFAPDIEISLEANPTSAEAASFSGYHLAGVNRLSMGIQSLQDRFLKFLGREHTVREAIEAIELARRSFENISFDLIYALPDQTLADWEKDLQKALQLAGDHISLYQLTIEPNTGFAGAKRRGEFELPVDELAEDMFDLTQQICRYAGYPAYEISNHARPGYECRHNLTYWRYGSYLGVGPGAHGRLMAQGCRIATEQIKKPETWLTATQKTGHGRQVETPLMDQTEKAEEAMLMGLRLAEGVWFENLRKTTGTEFEDLVNAENLAQLVKAGFVDIDQHKIWATDRGRFVLNSVLAELLS